MKNIDQAKTARENAYAPYSNYRVGAALELNSGEFVHGANIENASFGLSNCAERSAIYSAYSQGYKKNDFKSLTIIANHKKPVSPCGACRQVMYELLPEGCEIILANTKGDQIKFSKEELLPYGFNFEEINIESS